MILERWRRRLSIGRLCEGLWERDGYIDIAACDRADLEQALLDEEEASQKRALRRART